MGAVRAPSVLRTRSKVLLPRMNSYELVGDNLLLQTFFPPSLPPYLRRYDRFLEGAKATMLQATAMDRDPMVGLRPAAAVTGCVCSFACVCVCVA